MANSTNMLQLCRLCLVKDDVNIPIFEEQGDIRQIFLKISSCLPVKVSREDRLPKKICDGCSYKLDMLYEFWNTSANAEKQLLSWLGEAGVSSKMADGAISAMAQQMKPTEAFVKEETLEPADLHAAADEDEKDYLFEQQKVEESASAGPSATVTSNEEDEPPPKRARRTAAVKAAIAMDQDSDDDDDSGEPLTKVEDESEDSDGEDHVPAFVDVPSTSADDQPGPSGVGKDGVEAPKIQRDRKRGLWTEEALKSALVSIKDGMSVLKASRIFKIPRSTLRNHILSGSGKRKLGCNAVFSEDQEIELCRRLYKLADIGMPLTGTELRRSVFIFAEEHNIKHKFNIDSRIAGRKWMRKCSIKCHHCNKTFLTKQKLKDHKRAHKEKTIGCDICGKKFLQKNIMMKHKESVHLADYSTKCELCENTFKSTLTLNVHMKGVHLKNYAFFCDKCNKGFFVKKQMDIHRKVEHEEHRFECRFCTKQFKTLLGLKGHVLVHDPSHEKPEYLCLVCTKVFHSRTAFADHTRRHKYGEDDKITCEVCGKVMSRKYSLKVHMRTHTGEKPYSCGVCGRAFSTNILLTIHSRIHTGEKPHVCPVCGKRFRQKPALNVHSRYHTGEKPYSCNVCTRAFISKTLMKNHRCLGPT